MNNLGTTVRNIREEKKLSLNKLARISGVSPAYISKIENGKRSSVSYSILRKLANGLECHYELLLAEAGYDAERTFFVQIEGNDPIVVTVKDDVNRPEHIDHHTVLERWVTDKYDYKPYDYWEIATCEHHNI